MKDLKSNDKYDWIIATCNSEEDGIEFYKFYGSINEAKKKLVEFVKFDRNEDKESWDYGTTRIKDVDVYSNENELHAYGCYSYYHIDYMAKKYTSLESA